MGSEEYFIDRAIAIFNFTIELNKHFQKKKILTIYEYLEIAEKYNLCENKNGKRF